MYKRTPIQTQVRQTHCEAILICPMTEIINAEDVIKIKGPELQETRPYKLCTNLTAKVLMRANKLKVLNIKLDEDPLHHRIFTHYRITRNFIFTVQGNL